MSDIKINWTLDLRNSDRVVIFRTKGEPYPNKGSPVYITIPDSEIDMYTNYEMITQIYYKEFCYQVRFCGQHTDYKIHPISGEFDIINGVLLYQILSERR